MSLSPQQIINTINELQENFNRSGLTKQQISTDLNISSTKLEHLLTLTQNSISDPWILRNYLIEKVRENGREPIPFTSLVGDYHRYWFLNSHAIDSREITPGDN
ncbi:MAG: DUF2316 family protein [Liquorilactobacillus sp.]|uniref:DUF2316 family protein n=1 Tax=Liquorilactobacillus sp. TaxID=2767923 RepID=UPI0039EC284C